MAIEKKNIDIILDPDSPHAAIEETVLFIQHCRARIDKWTQQLRKGEDKLSALVTAGTAQQKLPVEPPAKPRKRGRKGAERPEGANAEAILDIAERGKISPEDLVLILFEDDTRENRKKVYSRVRHWKKKGWLGQLADESWVVPSALEEELKQLDEDV